MSYSCFEKRISGDCEVVIVRLPDVLHYVRWLFGRYLTDKYPSTNVALSKIQVPFPHGQYIQTSSIFGQISLPSDVSICI